MNLSTAALASTDTAFPNSISDGVALIRASDNATLTKNIMNISRVNLSFAASSTKLISINKQHIAPAKGCNPTEIAPATSDKPVKESILMNVLSQPTSPADNMLLMSSAVIFSNGCKKLSIMVPFYWLAHHRTLDHAPEDELESCKKGAYDDTLDAVCHCIRVVITISEG